ncbi:MAG: FMN-binding negative transcriptional regulator [Pseudomonadota bacterium]
MFQPPVFRETDTDVLYALMREQAFATVISAATGALSADHVPLVLHSEIGQHGVLRGHLAAGNPLFRQTAEREAPIDVLAVFQGPQTYVTPSWYASKREHGKVVPTWNYVVVHAHGTLRFVREAEWLLAHLHALTDQHESHRPAPWAVSDAPAEFIERQFRGLVGFEIAIARLDGTWKLSQNKNAADREGVEQGLRAEGTPEKATLSDLVRDRAREP